MLTIAPAPMLTREQAATRLAVDPDAVSALIATGQLPAVNVARSRTAKRPTWRIRPEDLAEFELRRMTSKPHTPTRRQTRRPTTKKTYF